MYILEKNRITDLVGELSGSYSIYGPVTDPASGQTFFDEIAGDDTLDISAPLPFLPPKHIIFPQRETIISYNYNRDTGDAAISPHFDTGRKALLGIRSCDLTAIQCLDRFFLGQEFVDEYYLHHRKNMFIVSNTCLSPFPDCFCACTDSGPSAREGFDINLTDIGDEYLAEAGSDKGRELAEKLRLKKGEERHRTEKERRVEKSLSLFNESGAGSKAWVSRVMNRVTTGFISEDTWHQVGAKCFECGACSFVCPTCSCFNVVDIDRGNGKSDRIRTWDSCSYEGYSRMAGGHNPRKPVEDRRNKRFFCKLSYSQSKKYLRPGCVGCGRCVRVCPGDIGLPNVATLIRREI